MNKIYITSLLLAIIVGLVSCGGDAKEDIRVNIKSVRATAPVSMLDREEWKFYVNEKRYEYVVNGRTIHALANMEGPFAQYIIYGSETLDNFPDIQVPPVNMLYASPNYPFAIAEPSMPGEDRKLDVEEVLDQSTKKKLLAVDALSIRYTGFMSPYIDNVKLTHRHNLLTYRLENFPKNSKVQLLVSGKEVQPFLHKGIYRAVLVDAQCAVLRATADGKTLEVAMAEAIKDVPVEFRLSRDMCYDLVLQCDIEAEDEREALKVSIVGRKWSDFVDENLETEKESEK